MKRVILVLIVLFSLLIIGSTALHAQSSDVSRIQGADRYDTAVQVSQTFYPDGASSVYIANAHTMIDALAAAPSVDGPILLVSQSALPPSTAEELQRLNPSRVVILGGSAAVSGSVEEQIRDVVGARSAQSISSPEDKLYEWTNSERADTLAYAHDVADVAEDWSHEMETNGELSHNPDMNEQICCWTRLTENIGVAPVSSHDIEEAAADIHEGFMGSDYHRDNITDPDVHDVGMGAVVGDCPDNYGSDQCLWVTQNFRG